MEKLSNSLEKISNPLALLAGFIFIVILAVLYALLGQPAILPVFFTLPLIMVTFATNISIGGALAILSTIIWLLIDLPRGQVGAPVWQTLSDALLGLILFLGAVYMAQEYKSVLRRERECAHEDPLTGLPNLRGFFELAEREITRAKRTMSPISVAYLGLDNINKVVEEHGQKTADTILRKLADSLISNTRGTDVSARIGDTDFLLLMSETGIEGGIKGIRRVNDLLMQIIEEYEMPVSFSIGLVTYNILPESIDQMISRADALKDESRQPGSDHIQHQVVDL